MGVRRVEGRPLKIDMICGHGADGWDTHVRELSAALARRGHEVTVLIRRDDAGRPDSASHGVAVEYVRAGPARRLPEDATLPYAAEFAEGLARRWAASPPDIAHAQSWICGLAARDGGRGLGVPVVQTFHGLGNVRRRHLPDIDTSPPERIRVEARVGLDAAAVIATCTDEVGELASYGIRPGRVHVVPRGLDLDRFRPEGPVARRGDVPRVLTAGRLLPGRGVDTAIEALCHLRDAELVVAGAPDGTDPESEAVRLERLAKDRGVAGRVHFLGHVPHQDIPALMRSADAFVSVPWFEPFGIAVTEAMACGVPVVASAVGGHLDTVIDGVTGLHVPPRVPGELAARLRHLFTEPRLGRALAAAAGARARARYPWHRIAAETEAVYERVLGVTHGRVAAPVSRLSGPSHARAGERAGPGTARSA